MKINISAPPLTKAALCVAGGLWVYGVTQSGDWRRPNLSSLKPVVDSAAQTATKTVQQRFSVIATGSADAKPTPQPSPAVIRPVTPQTQTLNAAPPTPIASNPTLVAGCTQAPTVLQPISQHQLALLMQRGQSYPPPTRADLIAIAQPTCLLKPDQTEVLWLVEAQPGTPQVSRFAAQFDLNGQFLQFF